MAGVNSVPELSCVFALELDGSLGDAVSWIGILVDVDFRLCSLEFVCAFGGQEDVGSCFRGLAVQ
jgi:hypothetical protein